MTADLRIDRRASLKEVERQLISAGVLFDREWDYAKDHHFRHYVLSGITVDEALAFADTLDAEEQADSSWPTVCAKAREIRSYLTGKRADFWRDGDRPAAVLSFSRRTCCWTHETGSYAVRAA